MRRDVHPPAGGIDPQPGERAVDGALLGRNGYLQR